MISGEPTLRQPDGETQAAAGDVVCFPARAGGRAHGARAGAGADALARIAGRRLVYPDSDKIGARPGRWGTHDEDRANFPR